MVLWSSWRTFILFVKPRNPVATSVKVSVNPHHTSTTTTTKSLNYSFCGLFISKDKICGSVEFSCKQPEVILTFSVFTRMHCVYPWSQTNLAEVFPFDYFKSCYIYLLLVFLFCTLLCLFTYFHYRLLISRARRQSVYEQNWEQQAKTLLHSTMSGQKHYRVTLELILVTFWWRLNQNSVGSNNVCELVVQCGWLYPVCVSSASTVGSCQIFWGKKKFWVVQ